MEEAEEAEQPIEQLQAIEKQEVMDVDTSEEFAEVFGSRTEFDSWDEFTALLEAFQKKTGSSFKPRSASSVEYANERRISGPIPERFVYSNVKMICIHYGQPVKRGSGSRKSYVAKGCGAFMNVSYNRGALRITQSCLIHNNHLLGEDTDTAPLRQLRVFNFTDELDLIVAREVMKCNPFEYTNGEKKWLMAVENLRNDDERLAHLTPRLIKKRIRFLTDKFLAVSHGKAPVSEDEMGNILYDLDMTRKETLDNPASRGRRKKGGPGRPRKRRNMSPFLEEEEEEEEMSGEQTSTSPIRKRGRPLIIPSSSSSSSSPKVPSADLTAFLSFLEKKDEQDRKMRQQEIDLRKEELAIQRREMELQKQRLELDKIERKAHLDLIRTQMRTLETTAASLKPQALAKETAGHQLTEYTIVVDNNNQMFEAVPGLTVT